MKSESESLFESLGLIIPSQYDFSEETLDAIEEAKHISRDLSVKSYSSAKELLEDCD